MQTFCLMWSQLLLHSSCDWKAIVLCLVHSLHIHAHVDIKLHASLDWLVMISPYNVLLWAFPVSAADGCLPPYIPWCCLPSYWWNILEFGAEQQSNVYSAHDLLTLFKAQHFWLIGGKQCRIALCQENVIEWGVMFVQRCTPVGTQTGPPSK